MDINHNASLIAAEEIYIEVPLQMVWTIQTNIQKWPEWQTDVTQANFDGDLVEGTVFTWKSAGLKIVSQLQIVQPQTTIGWTGKAFGTYANHIWEFETQEQGTLVRTRESMEGWIPRLIKMIDAKFLEKSLQKSLKTLKEYAEQQYAEEKANSHT